jgi:hypothetical protein
VPAFAACAGALATGAAVDFVCATHGIALVSKIAKIENILRRAFIPFTPVIAHSILLAPDFSTQYHPRLRPMCDIKTDHRNLGRVASNGAIERNVHQRACMAWLAAIPRHTPSDFIHRDSDFVLVLGGTINWVDRSRSKVPR